MHDVLSFAKDLERRNHHFFAVAASHAAGSDNAHEMFAELAASHVEHLTVLEDLSFRALEKHAASHDPGSAVAQAMGHEHLMAHQHETRVKLTAHESLEQIFETGAALEHELGKVYSFLAHMLGDGKAHTDVSHLLSDVHEFAHRLHVQHFSVH